MNHHRRCYNEPVPYDVIGNVTIDKGIQKLILRDIKTLIFSLSTKISMFIIGENARSLILE